MVIFHSYVAVYQRVAHPSSIFMGFSMKPSTENLGYHLWKSHQRVIVPMGKIWMMSWAPDVAGFFWTARLPEAISRWIAPFNHPWTMGLSTRHFFCLVVWTCLEHELLIFHVTYGMSSQPHCLIFFKMVSLTTKQFFKIPMVSPLWNRWFWFYPNTTSNNSKTPWHLYKEIAPIPVLYHER